MRELILLRQEYGRIQAEYHRLLEENKGLLNKDEVELLEEIKKMEEKMASKEVQ